MERSHGMAGPGRFATAAIPGGSNDIHERPSVPGACTQLAQSVYVSLSQSYLDRPSESG